MRNFLEGLKETAQMLGIFAIWLIGVIILLNILRAILRFITS